MLSVDITIKEITYSCQF